jgi:peptidoglycan/xylan/chitin deacetylase (PgdA/CDA1 family)
MGPCSVHKRKSVHACTWVRQVIAGLILMATVLPFNAHADTATTPTVNVPVLVYHRFGPTVADSMTTTTPVFEAQLAYIKEHDFHVIPLATLVAYLRGEGPPPPPHSIVITADDGHRSVYEVMLPLIQKYQFPVTLFIYPSAISNANYAMTWDQLRELLGTHLFTVESHTYWHPNFKIEKRKQAPADYEKFVDIQFLKSKATLEKKLGINVNVLAWPFGIYEDELLDRAKNAGYVAAFSIDRRAANSSSTLMAVPRFLMTNADQGKAFERLLASSSTTGEPATRTEKTH